MKKAVRSLAVPFLVVTVFLCAALYEEKILVRFGVATIEQWKIIFPRLLGIGIWLSLAYLANRVFGIMVWDPLNRRVPVPRLLRDVTAVLIYALAVTGIVGAVFNREIGPFWAASGAGAIVIGLALRNVILDIFIGLAVNFDRPFEIGRRDRHVVQQDLPHASPSSRSGTMSRRNTSSTVSARFTTSAVSSHTSTVAGRGNALKLLELASW